MILDSILDAIGKTPIVKLDKIGTDLDCQLFAKCEFLSPGGSLKDRIGYRMVENAEKAGRIKPGDTLIEPTSGNTGIGLAMIAAVKGYKLIVVISEKMSMEKEVTIKALGAEVVRTPTEAAHDDPDGLLEVTKQINKETPNSHILNQYVNPDNPDAHYEETAEEIWADFGHDLDIVVIGVGTGGTITGVAKKLKEKNPNIQIVGADPYGSILGGGDEVYPYHVEGIGYDFFPDVLDNSLVDQYIKVTDQDSFDIARKLIKEEGLLCGGSSGSVVWAALQAAQSLDAGEKCLCILPDGIRNYLGNFVSDDWMINNGLNIDRK